MTSSPNGLLGRLEMGKVKTFSNPVLWLYDELIRGPHATYVREQPGVSAVAETPPDEICDGKGRTPRGSVQSW